MRKYRIHLHDRDYVVTAPTRREALEKIRLYVKENPSPKTVIARAYIHVAGKRKAISATGATDKEAASNLAALITAAAK